MFVLNDLSTNLWVRYSKMNLGTRLVPISELFSLESTFSIIHVPSATFSLNHSWASSKWRRFLVICLASDAYTHAWLSSWIMVGCWVHPIAFIIPRLEMTSALSVWLTALISDSAVEVDTLPCIYDCHLTLLRMPSSPIDEWLPASTTSRIHPRILLYLHAALQPIVSYKQTLTIRIGDTLTF